MYARVVSGNVEHSRIPQAIQVFEEQVVPAARKQPGFVAIMQLLDRESNHAVSISIWETQEAMLKGELDGYYVEQVKKVAPFSLTTLEKEDYEVGVYDLAETFPPAAGSRQPLAYVRYVRTQFNAAKTEQGVKVYETDIIANAHNQEGYCSAMLLVDRESGWSLSISMWETEDALAAGETGFYYLGQIAKLLPFFASIPDREQYEAVIFAVKQ